jgi:oligopeptide transport system ATP-binding protein
LIKDELKQRKLDQFNKYYPTAEEVQTEKEKNSKKIEDLNKAIEGLREELETYKEEVSKDLDKLSPEIEEQQKEKAQALVIKNIQKKQNEIKEKIINLENEISKLSITNDATSKSLLKKIQMIFQDPIDSLDPRMTVKEIIAEGLYINGIKDKKVVTEKVYHALKLVGLMPEHASHYPHEFSGGQRQRVGIARAIACDPEVIIADEPISALDVSIQAQVINLLTDLKEKLGLTILFIAHDLSVVKHFSDTVAVMYFGKIVEMGDKEKVFDNPLHPYTKSLISSIPQPNPDYERLREGVSRYNPQSHNYTKDSVVELREVEPGHQVLCSQEEFEAYKRIVLENE